MGRSGYRHPGRFRTLSAFHIDAARHDFQDRYYLIHQGTKMAEPLVGFHLQRDHTYQSTKSYYNLRRCNGTLLLIQCPHPDRTGRNSGKPNAMRLMTSCAWRQTTLPGSFAVSSTYRAMSMFSTTVVA